MVDVGGSAMPNSAPSTLARIPLVWMIREIVLCNTGIEFDEAALADFGITLPTVLPENYPTGDASDPANLVLQPSQNVSALDKGYTADVVSPLHDELKLMPIWWVLEFFIFRYTWQGQNGKWVTRYRYVSDVLSRMEAEALAGQDEPWSAEIHSTTASGNESAYLCQGTHGRWPELYTRGQVAW